MKNKIIKISSYLSAVVLSFLLIACSNDDINKSSSNVTQDEKDNFVKCTVSGDKGGTFKAVGKSANIGYLSIENNVIQLFSVGFNDLNGASLSTGMFPLDLNSRSEQEGSILGMFTFNDGKNHNDQFSSQFYPLFYDTNEDFRDSSTYVTLTNVEKLQGGYLHLKGRFKFNASNIPEKLPEACMMEAFEHTDRHPTYLAKLAGTSEIHISGEFDVVILVKITGW